MANNDISQALQQVRAQADTYRLYQDYLHGRHRLTFATEKFRSAFGNLFRAFADNLCVPIVDAMVDRLVVSGFSVESGDAAAAEYAWEIWLANRMDLVSRHVHRAALALGDAYVIVWPTEDRVVIYPQETAEMTVVYDRDVIGRIAWAAKVWIQSEDGKVRLNLYYPDRIEKYVSRVSAPNGVPQEGGDFVEYQAENEPWPLPNPFGTVPVFHLANRVRPGLLGESELVSVIPLQDALNKAVADMLVAMEYVALPQRWATGLEVDVDETTGRVRAPFIPGADRIWAVADPNTRFGQFDPADLGQFLAVQDKFRQEIAAISRTPLHYIIPPSGQWPSGEALRSAESAFVHKVVDRQVAFGNFWEDVMTFALRAAGAPEAKLSCEWRSPISRGELEVAQAALMKQQLGVSQKTILTELGYTPTEIEQMQEDREATSAEFGERLLTAFERGV